MNIITCLLIIIGSFMTVSADCSEDLDDYCYKCIGGYTILDENECSCACNIIDDEIVFGDKFLTAGQALIFESPDSINDLARIGLTFPVVFSWDENLQSSGLYSIPYYFDQNLEDYPEYRYVIQSAISALYAQTCIHFQPAKVGDTSIVKFQKGDECSSFIGRPENKIGTVTGCTSIGDVFKELTHVLGLWDEISRPDRDLYVDILYYYIRYDKVKLFNRLIPGTWTNYSLPYDKSSVTHYGGFAFNTGRRPTIIDRETSQPLIPNRWAFSASDLAQLNIRYNCGGIRGVNETTTCYSVLDRGLTYRGSINVTESGKTCQVWPNKSTDANLRTKILLTASGLDNNYCRNPDMKERPWCYTENYEVEFCNITICDENDEELEEAKYGPKSVRGFWGPWAPFSECSVSCGWGFRYSTRRCIGNFTIGCGEGDYYTYETCKGTICTNATRWSLWESWGACDVECGNGSRIRTRQCENGPLEFGGCVGYPIDSESCGNITCPLYEGGDCFNTSNLNSYRGEIAVTVSGTACIDWQSSNIKPADYPTKNLTGNYCRNPKNKDTPYCFIARRKKEYCSVPLCNLIAYWGEWGNWSSCSVSCGEGFAMRTRQCIGGTLGTGFCLGNVTQTRRCSTICEEGVILPWSVLPATRPPMTTTPPVSEPDCVDIFHPKNYRGKAHKTLSGFKCQFWDAQYPWEHQYWDDKLIAEAGLQENYCRTPKEHDVFPWCYIEHFNPSWEYCKIDFCHLVA